MGNVDSVIPAPQGALGWTARHGWIYDRETAQTEVDDRQLTLVVVNGQVRVGHSEGLLQALLRLDTDVDQLVQRIGDLAEDLIAVSTGDSMDLASIRRRLDAVERDG